MRVPSVLLMLLGATACAAAPPAAKDPAHSERYRLPAGVKPGSIKLGDCGADCGLEASPRVLQNSEDWVYVEAHGVRYGLSSDWIGVFLASDMPARGGMLTAYPIRWQYVNTSCVPRAKHAMRAPGPGNGSCVGKCGTFSKGASCQCNSGCALYHDCCADHATRCPKPDPIKCVGQACCQPNNYTKPPPDGGTAKLGFSLVNMREPYVFALVQGSMQYPEVMAVSQPVTFARPAELLQAHLALTERDDEMRLNWASAPAGSSAAGGKAVAGVMYGDSPASMSSFAPALNYTFGKDQMCGAPANNLGWRDPGRLFTAVMQKLQPNTRYYYSFGVVREGGWRGAAGDLSFVSKPATASTTAVRFIAFGDMGKAPNAWDGSFEHSWDNPPGRGEVGSWNVTRELMKEINKSTLVMHIGDISYAVGYQSEWEEFMAQIEPLATVLPWMTAVGNHERNWIGTGDTADSEFGWLNGTDSGGECGVPYEQRFTMPRPEPDQPWYSYEYGPVSFVVMSTEHDFSTDSLQTAALTKMLIAVDRLRTPWLIFAGHRPMYVDSLYGDGPACAPLQKYIEPLLIKYKVDLALWGHHHSYHRSCAMGPGGVCTAQLKQGGGAAIAHGVVHAIIGAAGYEFSGVSKSPKPWVQFANDTQYGYARLTANETSMGFEFLRADGEGVLDAFELTRSPDSDSSVTQNRL